MHVRLALGLALLFAAPASAQVQKDLIEIGGGASFQVTPDVFLTLSPVLGYFITDRVEVGLNPIIVTDFEDGTAFLTAFGALHFPSSPGARTVPYVGANLGASLTDGGGLALGAQGGIKQFFLPGGALTVAAVLNTDDSFDQVQAGIQAGVSIFVQR